MINSYFRTAVSRQSSNQINASNYPSSKLIEKSYSKHRKYKLIIFVLARATQRALKQYW